MTLRLAFFGLSLSSSWGNGHATTYRALLSALHRRGHSLTFFEREKPWYAHNRDLRRAPYCDLRFYRSLSGLERWRQDISEADAVIVGSFVPDGVKLGRLVTSWARGLTAFYDIDTPVTLTALEAGTCTYLTPDLIPRYRLYLSFTSGPALQRLERRYGAPAARALYCSVDPTLYRPTGARKRWDLGYLGTYSADRQPTLERLLIEPARHLPDRQFVVAGSQYPAGINWPANVERIEHLPPAKHAGFYSSMGWTLNVTRRDMVDLGYSPSVRLFEAAACGTPIISDRWPGLGELFTVGRDILIADRPADVLAALALPIERRMALGATAQKRVLSRHTAAHRAEELESYLLEALDGDRKSRRAARRPSDDKTRRLSLPA